MNLFLYSIYAYFWFHLISRSDILARPRGLATRFMPRWMTYPISCAYCFVFWTTLALTAVVWVVGGDWVTALGYAFTAPVVAYLIDLVVRSLLHYLTPPHLSPPQATTFTD